MYDLAKAISPIAHWERKEYPYSSISWQLWSAAQYLKLHIENANLFGAATIRAAKDLVGHIEGIVPANVGEMMSVDQTKDVPAYQLGLVQDAIKTLETVMSNDMPGISAYLVSKKGIYDTQALIEHAENHLVPELLGDLAEKAKLDIKEAGKCLAFEVSTACAFHLWRAVETVAGEYYLRLTGKSFADDNIQRNWGAYIRALTTAHAEEKVTSFLDHIRSEYRNPQTHPDQVVTISEAHQLFGVAISSISQMIAEMQKLNEKPPPQAKT